MRSTSTSQSTLPPDGDATELGDLVGELVEDAGDDTGGNTGVCVSTAVGDSSNGALEG